MLDRPAAAKVATAEVPAAPWVMSERVRDALLNVLVAGAYWGLAELTLLPSTAAGRVTPMWPAAGLGVAALLLGGTRLLPGIAIGSLLTMGVRAPIWVALFVAGGATLEAIIDVKLLRRWAFDPRLERTRDVVLLSLVAAPAGAFVAAIIGATVTLIAGMYPASDYMYSLLLWWMRNWLGVQIVTSLALTWAASPAIKWTWQRMTEAVALVVCVAAVSQILFGLRAVFPGQGEGVPMAFLFFPIVGYAGLRFGPRGAATLVALLSAFALPVAALGLGPFGSFPLTFTQIFLHLFLLLASLSGQTLAAVMAERADSLQRRIALEEQLRHSQKMEAVGRLAGGIAHDFNNLLTAIIGYTEIVMMGFGPADPRRADAEEIKRAAERAADLTRQMLAFSRRQILQPKVVDLNVSLQKVEPMLRRVIGEDIVMTIAQRATRPMTRVDPGQIEQVIMNLVVNARDAMPKGGRLTVETGDASPDASLLAPRPGGYVMFAVSDTGIGMSPDVRARIFEPYYTTKEVGKGTGLGLSTAYGIIQQSDGQIHVYSEPGLGTTFRVYLPRSDGDATSEPSGVSEKIPGGTEHILLVEDDPSVRRSTRETLIRIGYSVTEAASGRAGLALGSDDTRHFDLALCDVILGDMSGPAVFEALRALRPSVRVLYMSGYADEAIVRTGVLDEGQPFLPKPFGPQDLAVKIREVLDANRE